MVRNNRFEETAVYTQTAGQEENPLIEALPPILSVEELHDAMRCVPALLEDYRRMTANERIALSDALMELYIPMDYTASIYLSVCQGMRSAYKGRLQRETIQQVTSIRQAMEDRVYARIPDSCVQAQSFSVLGEAGMGKTTTVNKILSLFPQVIRHTEYNGSAFKHTQVPYLRVECPSNDSPKGLCIQILEEMDRVMGTNLSHEETRKSSNVNMLIARIAIVCLKYSVGVIVVDEIQNVLSFSCKVAPESSKVVRFLVELSNKTGVCLLCVGMPQAAFFFDSEAHIMARTRGPRIFGSAGTGGRKHGCTVCSAMHPRPLHLAFHGSSTKNRIV